MHFQLMLANSSNPHAGVYTIIIFKVDLFNLQIDKYPLLRDQVEKIVVEHGRKGEAKSKDQVQ